MVKHHNIDPDALAGLDLITASIPVTQEVRTSHLVGRRKEMLEELEVWQFLNRHWGHINHLIGAINDVNALLGINEEIPEGLW